MGSLLRVGLRDARVLPDGLREERTNRLEHVRILVRDVREVLSGRLKDRETSVRDHRLPAHDDSILPLRDEGVDFLEPVRDRVVAVAHRRLHVLLAVTGRLNDDELLVSVGLEDDAFLGPVEVLHVRVRRDLVLRVARLGVEVRRDDQTAIGRQRVLQIRVEQFLDLCHTSLSW
ncbi:MAG: hypothetical protein EA382_03000 [Spirochaetaceae bacterium]|nr:MAG: hypothetical protein EA382_03000 [Spirochaetaceae bacterium]